MGIMRWEYMLLVREFFPLHFSAEGDKAALKLFKWSHPNMSAEVLLGRSCGTFDSSRRRLVKDSNMNIELNKTQGPILIKGLEYQRVKGFYEFISAHCETRRNVNHSQGQNNCNQQLNNKTD
jgi:hypothetical protein